ncbi:MAG: molecular chaperone DnaJ [Candidatus Saganbacteria bacterium]|nr:molecular chaperone DnaJ [Candidatus Saganbacteria bacterium]
MATNRDFYEILGVSKNASAEEIKRSYRRLARQYHPDVNKAADAEAKFKEISEAYSILGEEKKRQQYDAFGKSGFGGGAGGSGGFDMGDMFRNFEQGFGGGGFGDLGDLFETFFGRTSGRGQPGPAQGNDLRYDLAITLEEAASGIEKEITITHLETCQTCKGNGAKTGSKPETCKSCKGTGQVQRAHRTILGMFTQVTPCPTCGGEGSTIPSPCTDCKGTGRTRQTKKLSIKIPGGIDNDQRMRVKGEGDAGQKGGPHGDLYVFINVKEHPIFKREGYDLYARLSISFVQASLGYGIEVPVLGGKEKLKIPSGTQVGTTFRIKGKGMPSLHGRGRGDEYITIIVSIPTDLSNEEKDLLKKFQEARRKR